MTTTTTITMTESTTAELGDPVARDRWEIRATGCAIAVIGLHVLIDSFVDVRPGVTPGDHLVSGLVPLVALTTLAVGLRRLRPGAVAAIAVLLGIATTIGGVAAPAAALARGELRASSVTGLLATLGGVALIVIGVATAISTRRRGGPRGRRWARRGAIGAMMFATALFVAAPTGMGYAVANRSGPDHTVGPIGRQVEPVSLRTPDGLTLAAGYVPSRNGAAVIVFPGVAGERVTARAEMLTRHGYGVLVVEPRGNGASDGDPNLLGWSGEGDLVAAVDFLATRPDVESGRIGGLGLSVGGELMIQAGAHDARLAAVVSEGAGTRSVGEDLRTPFPASLVQLPFSMAATAATAVFSDSLPPARLGDLVGELAPRPLLLIWSTPGQGGEWFNPDYHDLAGPTAEIWEIPNSGHVDGLEERPVEYERRVIEFLDRALS